MWYEKKRRFIEGIKISSKLTDEQFEIALKEFYTTNDPTNISPIDVGGISLEESVLISKTLLYIVQRLSLFLLSPVRLQSDLSDLGFTPEKTEIIVKAYSECNRNIIQNLDTVKLESNAEVSWEIKTTLMDEVSSKCKKPAARISLKTSIQELILDDLNYSDLSALFDDFETIQRELDVLAANK